MLLKEASSSDVPLGVQWSGLVSSLGRLAFRCRSGAADATAGFARARGAAGVVAEAQMSRSTEAEARAAVVAVVAMVG